MRRAVLSVALLAAACARRAPPPQPASPLESLVARLQTLPPCSRAIPRGWSASWPVPVKERGRLRYRVFFFGRDGAPGGGFVFHEPEGRALFSLSGEVLECRREGRPSRNLPADGWQPGGTLEEIVAASRRLYMEIEFAAGRFDSGKPLSAGEKKRLADFQAAFASLRRPGHAAAYEALSPEFWAWVRAETR